MLTDDFDHHRRIKVVQVAKELVRGLGLEPIHKFIEIREIEGDDYAGARLNCCCGNVSVLRVISHCGDQFAISFDQRFWERRFQLRDQPVRLCFVHNSLFDEIVCGLREDLLRPERLEEVALGTSQKCVPKSERIEDVGVQEAGERCRKHYVASPGRFVFERVGRFGDDAASLGGEGGGDSSMAFTSLHPSSRARSIKALKEPSVSPPANSLRSGGAVGSVFAARNRKITS